MNGKLFLKNQLPVILMNLTGMLALVLFLTANGNSASVSLLVVVVWTIVISLYFVLLFFARKKRLSKLLEMTEQLEEKYLLPEVMEIPERAEEEVFYRILKMAEKSTLEKTGEVQRERKEYKEYIEQWIHEVKTPITAMKLLCENNPSPFAREILAQLENVNRFTEQALYYARSEHTEKDYLIREISLRDVVHSAIADNKYLLRQNHVVITADHIDHNVYTDNKWVRFILNQLISNAVKYRTEKPVLRFFSEKENDRILLSVEDNGMGIAKSDLPRIFEKGFTGQNGRMIQNSTGIGLYLCKRLCDKLGIGLSACSEGKGTTITLSFHINDFVTGVQG
ncbi:MAG: sensor histidine kinase [Eubacteriales bacterium]|nr:sensor histidine kinase [Eubacteriales bacterium]